nr:hypothetical protein [Tanacetum cinerariifolium]
RILETVVDKFMIRFGVNVSLDSGFPLNPEYGGGSGSGGCGDNEPGDDEDGGEDEEEKDDS